MCLCSERWACRPGHLRPGHADPDWACRLKDWECRPGIIKFTMWQTGCVRGRRGPCRWSTVVALPVGRTWWCSASVERTDVTRDYAASSVTWRCRCSRHGTAGGSVGTNSISTSSARHGRAGPSLAGRRAEQTSRASHFFRGASVGDDLWGALAQRAARAE